MRPNRLLLLLMLSVTVLSCKDTAKDATINSQESNTEAAAIQEDAATASAYKAADGSATFNDPKVSLAYSQYIAVKTSLVNSDLEGATSNANNLMTTFANIGVDQEALIAVQNLKESKTLDGQRQALSDLTPFLEVMVNNALDSGKVYKQFCPMALKNKGAYWLANTDQIMNPYFGDAMLKCGKVAETLEGSVSAAK